MALDNSVRRSVPFPSEDAVKQATQHVTNEELANHFLNKMTELANTDSYLRKNIDLKTAIIESAKDFAEKIKLKFSDNSRIWQAGDYKAPGLGNLQSHIADRASHFLENSDVKDQLQSLIVDFAVNQAGHFIRGYSSDLANPKNQEGMQDPKVAAALDDIFNAWLASESLIIKDGDIYPMNDKQQNEESRLSHDQVVELIENKGIEKFMESKGIHVEYIQQEYPGDFKEAKTSAAEQSVPDGSNVAVTPSTANDSPDADTPHAGGRH